AERADDPARVRLDRRHDRDARQADRRQHPACRKRRIAAPPDRMMRGPVRFPFFYGWLLVGIAFVTMAVGVNARTAFSLLFPPILDEFGWDRGVTAGIFSFGFLVSAMVTPCVGRLMDRRGPMLVVELGVVAMAAGLLLAAWAHETWQLYLTLGGLVGSGINCLAYTGQSLYLTRWFVRRRGLALSIAFSGVGIGSVTMLPWMQSLIAERGWRTAGIW